MLGQRELDIDDYLAILKRRIWWIVVPAIAATVISFVVSLFLPEKWTSTTSVLVEQQKVPDNYVKPVVTEDLDERLATMKEQILSRTRLEPMIVRFELYPDKGLSVEDRLDRMRKAIKVSAMRSEIARTGGLPGFYISYTGNNARTAQQVCSEIMSLFLSENLRAREQTVKGTTDFLKAQLEDAKRSLDEQDSKLATFQRKYIGQLPGQEQANFNMLTTLVTQLDASTQALNRLQQDRSYVDSLVGQQVAAWKTTKPGDADSQGAEQRLQQMQSELVSLEARYTSDHPDVVKQRRSIEAFKAKMAEGPSAAPKTKTDTAAAVEPAEIQKLRAQLRAMDMGIVDKKKEQENIQRQIGVYQGRIQLSPVVQEEFKKITRDYQTAQLFYNELLTKKNQSEMATDLEHRQQSEQFRVMDPPNLPENPTFPIRWLFALGGLAGGFVLGFGLVFWLEAKDKSIRDERDVKLFLQLPTLAVVPSLDKAKMTSERKLTKRMRRRQQLEELSELERGV